MHPELVLVKVISGYSVFIVVIKMKKFERMHFKKRHYLIIEYKVTLFFEVEF